MSTTPSADACCPWRGEGVTNCPTQFKDYSTGDCDSAMEKYCLTQDVELDEYFQPRKTAGGETIYTAPNLFRSDMCAEWMRNRKQATATNTFEKVCSNTTNKVFVDKAKTKVGPAVELPECACIKARDNLAKSPRLATVAPECVLTSCVLQKAKGWSTYDQSMNTCNVTYCEMNMNDVGITAGDKVDTNFIVKQNCGSTAPPPPDPNVKPPSSAIEDAGSPTSPDGSTSGSGGSTSVIVAVTLVVLVLLIVTVVVRRRRAAVGFGRRRWVTRGPRRGWR